MSLTTAIHAPRGSALSCKGWHQEAAFRMIQNNLDPEVAENPDELIVYGGRGRAARGWPRSEERRVGKKGRFPWAPHHLKKKKKKKLSFGRQLVSEHRTNTRSDTAPPY